MHDTSPSPRWRLVAAALAALLSAPLAAQPTVQTEGAIRALMAEAQVPGVSLAVVEDGAVAWTGAYGLADVESEAPVTPETVFEAASLSKPVTAYVALRLAERGVIDLDAPLWDVLPYERLAHDARARTLTPRLVLTHRTGLPNWGATPLDLSLTPDERWGYSGEGFVYLQRAMEAATGEPLDALARREVFEPFGMTHSSFVRRDGRAQATGYDMLGEPRALRQSDDANAAASLVTTAGDYARFLAGVLRGDGLAAETAREALARQTDVPAAPFSDDGDPAVGARVGWGLGWGVQDNEGRRAIWHWGDNGSFRAFVVGDPDRQSGVVFLTNSENGLSFAEDLLALVSDAEPWAVRWLGYGRYDDPVRRARIQLGQTFLAEGAEAGLRLWDTLSADLDIERELTAAARLLADRGRPSEALAVAERVVEAAPESAEGWAALGEVQTATGDHRAALASLERALALAPEFAGALEARLAWLREGLAEPVALPAADLRALAGRYGERQLVYRDGALHYARVGSTSETTLTPLGDGLFRLASSSTFRIRVLTDEAGRPSAVEGRYANGHRDVSERTD